MINPVNTSTILRMTGLTQLYLGYGSINPERMDRLIDR